MFGRRLALTLLMGAVLVGPVAARPVARAAAVDWSRSVAATPDGGFRMGNPRAKVKLVEYGSLTCPHCRAFDAEGVPTLVNTYVKSGKVSWEFRNYIRDPFDLTAALIARCNGAASYFPMTRALFKDQGLWFGRALSTPKEKLEALQPLPANRQFAAAAKVVGLDAWAAKHGLPMARSTRCLTNQASIDQLVRMTGKATDDYPEFQGTPTFLINGTLLKNTANWDGLEPQLKAALGG